jgi:hypothetical protein
LSERTDFLIGGNAGTKHYLEPVNALFRLLDDDAEFGDEVRSRTSCTD